MTIIDATQESFAEMLKIPGYIFVDFNADWCPPCKFMHPFIEQFSNDEILSHVRFLSVDVDANPDLSAEYQVRSIPTFYILKVKEDGSIETMDKTIGGQQDMLGFKQKIINATPKQ
jgi:thiol-disulfide isomerase/thioredoxin